MKKWSKLGWVVTAAGVLSASACNDDSDSSDSPRAGSSSGAKSGAGGSSGSSAHAGGGAGGEGDDACRTDVACGVDGIAFLECPSKLSDLDLTCQRYITIDRYQACGGTVLHLSNGIQESQYTFRAGGKLVGTYSSGDVGDHACFGEPCSDLGAREIVCDGVMDGDGGGGNGGGAGGFAGNGGAGGAP